jgi:hypothetical protein
MSKIRNREVQGKNTRFYDWKKNADGRMLAIAKKKGGPRALAVVVMTWAMENPKVPFTKNGALAYINSSRVAGSKSVYISDMDQPWRIMSKIGFCTHLGSGEYLCHPNAKARLNGTTFVFIEDERRDKRTSAA